MRTVAFFVRHFTERGTEVSVYNYAHYNETLLGNRSLILCFTPEAQKRHGLPDVRLSFARFADRFQIIEIDSFPKDMPDLIRRENIDFFYTQTHGNYGDIYDFNNRNIWIPPCRTIKHCVFHTDGPESDFYVSIGADHNTASVPVLPYMVPPPLTDVHDDLREELGIPKNAFVFGRHGGASEFDIPFVRDAIQRVVRKDPSLYFVFMNTNHLEPPHPQIKYLPPTTDLRRKTQFIRTCDAMIHARNMGETFGMACAEFSVHNKPVFTCANRGSQEHTRILGFNAVPYYGFHDLVQKLHLARNITRTRQDWNAYRDYSPEKVMNLFDQLIFSSG